MDKEDISPNSDNVIIYGVHPILDAVKEGKPLEKIMLQQGLTGAVEIEMRKLSKAHGIPMTIVPKDKLAKMTKGGSHQGVVGVLSLVTYYSIETILPQIIEKQEIPLLLILDGVTDVRNFGAIARTAELSGVHTIIIPEKGSAAINAEAMKASAGALNKIPICRERSISNVMDFLGRSGVQVLVSHLGATAPLYEMDFSRPTAIIMGSEDEGVNRAFVRQADASFIIPQIGTVDSFNVSVATGIILYEAMKQRIKK